MGLITYNQSQKYLENLYTNNKNYKFSKLCIKVMLNDVSATTILQHYEHIINNNCYGIVQYYSLQGSYFINRYLRNKSKPQNILLDDNIIILYNLLTTSQPFDKKYILYRFIQNDDY